MRIRIQIIMIFLGITFAVSSQSPRVRDLQIHGNTLFSDQEIANLSGLQKNRRLPDKWSENALDNLKESYRREGYFTSAVDSINAKRSKDSLTVDISIWLNEGQPVHINKIQFNQDIPFTSNRLKNIQTDLLALQGFRYQEYRLEGLLDKLMSESANVGFPLASVELQNVALRLDSLNLNYQYRSGPEVYIDTIRFTGNKLTQDYVLLRELRFSSGSIFNKEQLDTGRDNLQRLGFFKQVNPPEFYFLDKGATITYKVKEGNPNTIDGLIGYAPPKTDKPGAKGTFTGRLEFVFKNLMGTGRLMEAFWQKKEDNSQAIRFAYEEPWILGYPISAGGQFEQIIRDSTYLERDRHLSVRYSPWSTLSCDLSLGQTDILPDSLGQVLLGLQSSKRWYVSFGFNYQTFDNPFNPTRGVRYETRLYEGTKQGRGIQGRSRYHSLWIDVEWAYSILYRQIIYFGFHGREVKIGDQAVPIEDQIRLGGAYSLRGYNEDSFRGHQVVWLNNEYRLIMGEQSRAFLFCDVGLYERRNSDGNVIKKTKMGYGLGVRLETGLGRIGIDYGLGAGDGLLQGKVHVGLQNQF